MTLADDIDAAGCGMGSCLGVPFKCLRISKEAGGAAGMLHPSLQLLLCSTSANAHPRTLIMPAALQLVM